MPAVTIREERQFRALWSLRINAGARVNSLSHSRFIAGRKKATIRSIAKYWLIWRMVNEKAAFAAAIVEKS
jgi:large subunit ribosomal protein L20